MSKKILFLYNGGTVGMVPEKRGQNIVLVPPKDSDVFKKACESVIEKLEQENKITFEFITSKDSTNMTPNDWEKLVFRIKKAQDEENYDAVAIVHGTDTLAYTSIALALALHGKEPGKSGLRIPVCITGAQNPVYEIGGDGRFNLENLFRTIDEAMRLGIADVLVNFWNKIFLGSRVLKRSEKDFEAFDSPAYPPVGIINAKGVNLNVNLIKKKADAAGKLQLAPKFGRGVVSFELTPGVDPNVILGFITGGAFLH